jgi:tRNA A-37 threonylcarbamoyl transferase component Bud32
MNNLQVCKLKEILDILDQKKTGTKDELISRINNEFAKYKKYKKKTKNKYVKIRQLGNKGKEGICYLVKDKDKNEFAMKTFSSKKSYKNILKEAEFQSLASSESLAPIVYDVDPIHKYIVMQRLNNHLLDLLKINGGKLSLKHQKRILHICKKLDKLGIFYNDPNLQNFMINNETVYLIDYGMCVKIDKNLIKKLGTEFPNQVYLKSAIICKLKEANCPIDSYKLLC